MNVYELGKYYFDLGEFEKAKKIIEGCIKKWEVSDIQTLDLVLSCCVELGQRDEYIRISKSYALLSGLPEPDFKYLERYLNLIEDGLVLIHGKNKKGKQFLGTGFSLKKDKIITAETLIRDAEPEDIQIIGRLRTICVKEIIIDPSGNIAILLPDDILKYQLHLGEFSFTLPGEIVAVPGFTKRLPLNFKNCISITKTKIKSIDRVTSSRIPQIILEKKMNAGYNGSPVINELGFVIGII